MYDEITIGARLRALRRWRGMTLDQVAGLSGLSAPFLSRAERGQRALDRRSHIAALARALRVSEVDLVGGPHITQDSIQSGPHHQVPGLRAALTNAEIGEAATDHARPLADLVAEVAGPIKAANRRNDWTTVLSLLPPALDELHFHAAEPADEQAYRTALSALLDACQDAAGIIRLLGYADLGYVATKRAYEAATALEDPTARGKAMYMFARPTGGDWQRAARRSAAEADRLEPNAADGEACEVLGMLCLNTALVSAAGLDADEARTWLARAEDLARRVPDDLDNWQSFSATNVAVWRVKIEVELGEAGGKVLELADAVDREKIATYPARHVNFLGEVGRGLARDRRTRDEAVRWLRHAERVGPARIRNHAPIRESVAVMLEQARVAAQGRELRGMASRMGVPH